MEDRDDKLTTADLAGTGRSTEVEAEPDEAESGNHPSDADAVEPGQEPANEAANTEAGGPSSAPSSTMAGERDPEADREQTPLLPEREAAEFQSRWEALQISFVDEPRRSVQDGDGLVADLMQRLADSFARERESLEAQWDRGDDVSTEDLRVALQRYRSFFDRLLSA